MLAGSVPYRLSARSGVTMGVYDQFFLGITPEQWEFFGEDFLSSIGFTILTRPARGPDGGADFLVEHKAVTYLVSAKHFIHSDRSVGVNDEISIVDRMEEHGAGGFIGFYSTTVSSALQKRFDAIKQKKRPCLYYDNSMICDRLPLISSSVLQKYGLPNHIRYCLNVDEADYRPLPCMACGRDILEDRNIPWSMALVCENKNGELEYIYGCKHCLSDVGELYWTEVSQALHLEQLNSWISIVNDLLSVYSPSADFFKHRSQFEGAIQQRMFPSNWGRWLS